MHDISIVTADVNNPQIKPMRIRLGDYLCRCYGMVAPQHKKSMQEDGLVLSAIPFFVAKIASILARYHIIPNYYVYYSRIKAIDMVFSYKIANDSSKIVFANPLFSRTVSKAKRCGKKVVVVAGNSEPDREHKRVLEDYKEYCIRHKYIYGDASYAKRVKTSYSFADKIITISEVSRETYKSAGYDMSKFELIPLTGTDFPIQTVDFTQGKDRFFISTAFHNFVKGTQRLLLAWKKAQIRDIPLMIVGKVCEDLQEFIEKYGPFENVQFVGHQSNLKEFYSTCDAVGVLLSLSEGAGRVTPEMMSFGFPMITSPDATCDIVKDGENGFVVDPLNEQDIINKLHFFANNWGNVRRMRPRVLETVNNRTVRDFAEEVAEYVMSLI